MAIDAEVGVVGLGSMGSLVLRELAKRGTSAIGFEQYAPGHDQGAAGGDTRVFRTAYRESQAYVPLLLRARKQWHELEDDAGVPLLTLCGGLNIGAEDAEWLQAIRRCAETFDLEHEVLDQSEVQARYPQHVLDPGEIAVLDHVAGVLRSEYATLSAARLAEDLGAVVKRHTRVDELEATANGVRVSAGGESYHFERVIHAAGPWAAGLLEHVRHLLEVRRAPMTWFGALSPGDYAAAKFPTFTRDTHFVHMFGTPSIDGYTVKAATNNPGDVVVNPDRLDRSARGSEATAMNAAVGRYLPGLVPDPVRVSIYMEAYTPDGHGLVGALPELPNVVVLCGFSGHGFKLAPVVAEAATDLALEGVTELPIDHWLPGRFTQRLADDPVSGS